MELNQKIVLKDKGEVVNLPTVKQLVAKMKWKTEVDLDLIALYEPKNGDAANGVSFKNLGNLNAFPFIALSGDAGIGATVADGGNEEILKATDLSGLNKLHLCVLNYTEAQKTQTNSTKTFSNYDGHIELTDDSGNVFDIPLKATKSGTVGHIATIDNTSPIGATLEMKDDVMQFSEFVANIPGARAVFQ